MAYNAALALRVAQNEALLETLAITTTNEAGDTIPLPLSGYTLKAQFKRRRSVAADPEGEFTIVITDAENGAVQFSLTKAVVSELHPGSYVYDLLGAHDTDDPENFWTSAFIVDPAVTSW